MKTYEPSLEVPPTRQIKVAVPRQIGQTVSRPVGSSAVRLKSILVPVDFSDPSSAALDEGARLAERFGGHLTLVHVIEGTDAELTNGKFRLHVSKGIEATAAKSQMEKLVRERGIDAALVEQAAVLEGPAFYQICELARKSNTDLIAIATHGFTGLKHLMLGSTAERVARYAPCPVLVARNHLRQRDAQGKLARLEFRKILVPLDFSEFSVVAMNYASAFARDFGAERRFIHAVYPKYYFTGSDGDMIGYAKLLDDLEGAAEKQMADFVKQRRFVGKKVSSAVHRGHPVTVILDEANDAGSDLIVIPTHGRTGFKRAWLGSVAENVVRLAKCDVLVVRSREHDFV